MTAASVGEGQPEPTAERYEYEQIRSDELAELRRRASAAPPVDPRPTREALDALLTMWFERYGDDEPSSTAVGLLDHLAAIGALRVAPESHPARLVRDLPTAPWKLETGWPVRAATPLSGPSRLHLVWLAEGADPILLPLDAGVPS